MPPLLPDLMLVGLESVRPSDGRCSTPFQHVGFDQRWRPHLRFQTWWLWDCSAPGQGEIPGRLADAGSGGICGCHFLLEALSRPLVVPLFELRGNPRSRSSGPDGDSVVLLLEGLSCSLVVSLVSVL